MKRIDSIAGGKIRSVTVGSLVFVLLFILELHPFFDFFLLFALNQFEWYGYDHHQPLNRNKKKICAKQWEFWKLNKFFNKISIRQILKDCTDNSTKVLKHSIFWPRWKILIWIHSFRFIIALKSLCEYKVKHSRKWERDTRWNLTVVGCAVCGYRFDYYYESYSSKQCFKW